MKSGVITDNCGKRINYKGTGRDGLCEVWDIGTDD